MTERREQSGVIVGLDASRNRSGGAIAHIKGLLSGGDPRVQGIDTVHLWAHAALLELLEPKDWLVKHPVAASNGSILRQILWQRFKLPHEARKLGIEVMFNTDAGSVCPFQPSITLSQDMLSYEPGEMQRYPWWTKARLRLQVLRVVQLARLRKSTVAVFLTSHAAQVIGPLAQARQIEIIPHGIDAGFFGIDANRRSFPASGEFRGLYVSNAAPYKHQWHVIEGIARARKRTRMDIRLRLVGGGSGGSQRKIEKAILRWDPDRQFVQQVSFVPNSAVRDELANADLFVFASSCENMPITLLEAMAAALPIASSNRGPMVEVLGPTACYFDPEDPVSIADAILALCEAAQESAQSGRAAQERARAFTWEKCAAETWRLMARIAGKARS